MEFLPKKLEEYADNLTSKETEVLTELNRDTQANVLIPRMLSGHVQGRFLSMISHMLKPKHILEIGTYTGYSAICLAEGMAEGGILDTIDINEELETMVAKYFEKAGISKNTNQHIGNALEIIPQLEGDFDLVFIDADKENYINYFDLVIDRMNPGGIIIADNVLWSGKVLDEAEIAKDEETRVLVEYSNKIHQDPRVENILLPIRDGLMMARVR